MKDQKLKAAFVLGAALLLPGLFDSPEYHAPVSQTIHKEAITRAVLDTYSSAGVPRNIRVAEVGR